MGEKDMSTSVSRRRLVAGTCATAALISAGIPMRARGENAIALRISSSLTADQNSAHYIWYQRFAANLKTAAGFPIAARFFPDKPPGQESEFVPPVKVRSI